MIKSYRVPIIQLKATIKQYSPVVLFILAYSVPNVPDTVYEIHCAKWFYTFLVSRRTPVG